MPELIRIAPSERGPVPAVGFFGPSHENENWKLPVFNSSLDTSPSLPPSRQQIRLSAPPLPCRYGQCLHPSQRAVEQPSSQMALGQQQPVVACVLDQPATGLHQPLVQTARRPVHSRSLRSGCRRTGATGATPRVSQVLGDEIAQAHSLIQFARQRETAIRSDPGSLEIHLQRSVDES